MKASTIITISTSFAIALTFVAFGIVIRYSATQHLTKNFKSIAIDAYQPGSAVILKPGKIYGIVLERTAEGISVCVPDASGGVKTQLVSPLILERSSQW